MKLKKLVQNYTIKKETKLLQRNKASIGLERAKRIGVLFKYSKDKEFKEIKRFLRVIAEMNKNVFALGYIENPEEFSDVDLLGNINYFNKKELNWFGKPICETGSEFLKEEFDILVYLSPLDVFPLQYISQLSKACFKVGKKDCLEHGGDACISTKEEKGLEYFIEQLIYYLKMIN